MAGDKGKSVKKCKDPTEDVYFLAYLIRKFVNHRMRFEIEADLGNVKPDVIFYCDGEVGVIEITIGGHRRTISAKRKQVRKMCDHVEEALKSLRNIDDKDIYLYVASSSEDLLKSVKRRGEELRCHVEIWKFQGENDCIKVSYERPVCFSAKVEDTEKLSSLGHFLIPVFGGKDDYGYFYRCVAESIRDLLVSGQDITEDSVCGKVYRGFWKNLGEKEKDECLSKVSKILKRLRDLGEKEGIWHIEDGVIKSDVKGKLTLSKWRKIRNNICEEQSEEVFTVPLPFDDIGGDSNE